MKTSNYYKEVIEILEGDHPWRKIIVEIAKSHPSLIVNIVNNKNKIKPEDKLLLFLKSGKTKINCIKECRALMGIELKEAKDYIESLAYDNGVVFK